MSQPPSQPSKLPDDYEEMEFTIEDEGWNEYELKDGVRIRGRVVLQKVIRDPNNPNLFNFHPRCQLPQVIPRQAEMIVNNL